jgi:hypothetical protein
MVLDAERLSINLDRHIGINSFTGLVGDSCDDLSWWSLLGEGEKKRISGEDEI